MKSLLCVGGLGLDGGENLRLLQPNAYNQPLDTPFDIGEIWEIQGRRRDDCIPPHVEDFLVTGMDLLGREPNLARFLAPRVRPWRGGAKVLFGGAIRFTSNHSGYICRQAQIPPCSTGFWIPDRKLTLDPRSEKATYHYARHHWICRLPYVGTDPAQDRIPAGTLLRVSLARWWRPEDAPEMEERCYLQLSGWYDSKQTFTQQTGRPASPLRALPDDEIPF